MPYRCHPFAQRLRAPVAPAEAGASPGGGITAGLLDAQALARLHELDPGGRSGLVQRVLSTYTQSLQRLLEQLHAARAADDRAAMRHAAHTLKSSSASIGAMQLSAWCAQVENQIRLDADADVRPGLAAMRSSLERALQAIRRELGEAT